MTLRVHVGVSEFLLPVTPGQAGSAPAESSIEFRFLEKSALFYCVFLRRLSRNKARFFYDYGDGWEVILKLEEIFEDKDLPGRELPRVMEGDGFGIIEDSGGPAGLEHIRDVFLNKTGSEYKNLCEWLGVSNLDLSSFDLQDLNFRLKKIPRIFRELYEYDHAPTKRSIELLERKYLK